MAKYKKKKLTPETKEKAVKSASSPKASVSAVQPATQVSDLDKKPKRLASGSLKLQFAGDLILVKNTQRSLSGLFKRYAALFEALANLPKEQRGLVYKVMTGLMLTSHAKKRSLAKIRESYLNSKTSFSSQLAMTVHCAAKLNSSIWSVKIFAF